MNQYIFFGTLFLFMVCVSMFTVGIALLSLPLTLFYKRLVIGLGIFIPLSFIVANVLFSQAPNLFSRIVYIFSSYLGGIFIYWFIGSILISLFVIISRFVSFPLASFSSIVYILASVVACAGIAQAFFTKVTTYTVKTPPQYTELIGRRIALIADTHFGAVNQQMFARKVVQEVLATQPDAVLIAGDMFDGPRFDTTGVEKEMRELTKKVPVIFTPGNHEEYGPYNDFLDSARRMGMTVLVDQKSTLFGIPVFGLNYRSRKDPQEVQALLSSQLSPSTPSIVLNHEPSFQNELTQAGVFLVVSGHTHGGQFWPGIFFARRVYKEYVYGLVTKGMFQSVTTNGIGTFGPRFRTFNTGEVVVLEFK